MSNVVSQVVYRPARRHPDRPAVITRTGEVFSYAQAAEAVGQLAWHLRTQGIRPGQVVGVSMSGHSLHLLTLLALAQVGAVSLPLHPAAPAERRLLAARTFGATCVVSESRDLALAGLTFIGLDRSEFRSDGPSDRDVHPTSPDDPMHIMVSSGTSGDPKAMVWTHGNVARRNQTFEPGGDSLKRVLQMDLNFFVGFGPALRALAHADALVFPMSPSAEHVLLTLITQKITHAYLSPHQASLLAGLVGANVANACPDLVSLRVVGERLNAQQLQALRRRLTPNVYVAYGAVEAGVATLATPDMLERHPETVGAPSAWAEVQVIDAAGAPVPAGTVGEIRIRSTQQVSGYHLDEARTQARFRDGWFHPNDRGHVDAEGLLYIEGRVDDMINVGGAMVDAEDVERTLCAHPAVREAGAFVHARADGQAFLSAALVLADAGRLAEVQAYAQAKLGPLAPVHYVLASALPRTATGKIQRRLLAAAFPPTRADAASPRRPAV
ncbi:class I adenylate-forming enzyme family protein [Azospirillum sp. TSO22-1]|uniref:class I adenylate-forming enzyme family protein n=1 Tax=Azospirillum sp. TSO22-1 TaxID=716789 RepID=UPI000D610605|nr:class I adenylate-forming enzyme family protein [Azospirillum sp. TSO22-1]PWC56085.1 hypothetical protein TSO221_03330 [Azospirillum sp. TSO22-1]